MIKDDVNSSKGLFIRNIYIYIYIYICQFYCMDAPHRHQQSVSRKARNNFVT